MSAEVKERKIAFLIYPDLTVFDLVGPLQVFSALHQIDPQYRPVVVAETRKPVATDIGVHMIPNATFDELLEPYALIVPGGDQATLNAMTNPAIREYIRATARTAEFIGSVCTGALILASVGLLEGRQATTHWAFYKFLEELGAHYVRTRWVDNGRIINSAGVSAGIDMALHFVGRIAGEDIARQVQLAIQYDPNPPLGCIDYEHLGLIPSVMRRLYSLRAPFVAAKPKRLTALGL